MNLRTLNDMNKDQKKDQKDNQKKTNSYAGGENSGLAIENPDDRKNIQDILAQAQQQSSQKQDNDNSKVNCKITLYSNGFQINDEPFKDYSDPKNKQFLQELKSGRVPMALRNQYPDGLYVGIDDRTSQTYTPPPPPKYIAFGGSGVNFGPQQQQQQQQQQIPKIEINKSQLDNIPIDQSQPTTQIMVRLFDGQSLTITVNLNTQITTIYNHIKNIVKPGQKTIQLISGFPPRPIQNLNQTVESADLMESEIKQTYV